MKDVQRYLSKYDLTEGFPSYQENNVGCVMSGVNQ